MSLPILIYCYDAYCGWCFGFGGVIKNIEEKFAYKLQTETLAGGMITPEKPVHISVTADYILNAIPKVEAMTGAKFGSDYLWHLQNPTQTDWFPNSLKPAIAACIVKEKNPLLQVKFIEAIQFGLFVEGRDLTDDEAYRHLLPLFGFEADDFYTKLNNKKYLSQALQEFETCKQLRVQGFPALYLQHTDGKIYAIANGYTSEKDVESRINKLIHN
ncbi:MAG: DsbA family protein [Chitinophagaceae bacterium]